MMKIIKKIFILIILMMTISTYTFADVGSFEDYPKLLHKQKFWIVMSKLWWNKMHNKYI